MYVLYKDFWGDFDIAQSEVVAVSENIGALTNEAARLNGLRKPEDFKNDEWSHKYRAANKHVKVI